jgi:hypothetical protein
MNLQIVKIHIKEKESDWIQSHKRKKTLYIHQILIKDIEDLWYPQILKYIEKDRDWEVIAVKVMYKEKEEEIAAVIDVYIRIN